MVFREPADTQHTKSQHVSLFINSLHDGIVSSRAHETRRLTELHFQVVPFRVKPDLYFVGHIVSPSFSRSVRYAVTTNPSAEGYFTTTHSHFPPTRVLA